MQLKPSCQAKAKLKLPPHPSAYVDWPWPPALNERRYILFLMLCSMPLELLNVLLLKGGCLNHGQLFKPMASCLNHGQLFKPRPAAESMASCLSHGQLC